MDALIFADPYGAWLHKIWPKGALQKVVPNHRVGHLTAQVGCTAPAHGNLAYGDLGGVEKVIWLIVVLPGRNQNQVEQTVQQRKRHQPTRYNPRLGASDRT
jgi:hypothetical protein